MKIINSVKHDPHVVVMILCSITVGMFECDLDELVTLSCLLECRGLPSYCRKMSRFLSHIYSYRLHCMNLIFDNLIRLLLNPTLGVDGLRCTTCSLSNKLIVRRYVNVSFVTYGGGLPKKTKTYETELSRNNLI